MYDVLQIGGVNAAIVLQFLKLLTSIILKDPQCITLCYCQAHICNPPETAPVDQVFCQRAANTQEQFVRAYRIIYYFCCCPYVVSNNLTYTFYLIRWQTTVLRTASALKTGGSTRTVLATWSILTTNCLTKIPGIKRKHRAKLLGMMNFHFFKKSLQLARNAFVIIFYQITDKNTVKDYVRLWSRETL